MNFSRLAAILLAELAWLAIRIVVAWVLIAPPIAFALGLWRAWFPP